MAIILHPLPIIIYLITNPGAVDSIPDIGDAAYDIGEYRLAELELRRKLFFDEDHFTRQESLMLGYCFLKDGNYLKGTRMLRDIMPEGSLILARYYLSSGNYRGAEIELKDLILEDHSDSIREMLGLSLLLEGDLENARRYISLEGLKLRNAGTAILLSTIVPGTGEIYAGKPWLGLLDLSINGLTDYFLYRSIARHNFLDASIIVYFLTFRFYNGSRNNAYKTVEQKNIQGINQFIDRKGLKRWLRF